MFPSFFYSVFRFLRWGRSVELALLFTGRYVSRGDEARFRTPPGCECNLLPVLGLEKPTFATVPIGARFMVASARSREPTRTVGFCFKTLMGFWTVLLSLFPQVIV